MVITIIAPIRSEDRGWNICGSLTINVEGRNSDLIIPIPDVFPIDLCSEMSVQMQVARYFTDWLD